MEEYVLDYLGSGVHPSQCHITFYPKCGLVVATEIDAGTSVTNAVACIATEVLKRHGIKPDDLFFIERYTETQTPFNRQGTADLVSFDQADEDGIERGLLLQSPRWDELSVDKYREIITTAQRIEAEVEQLRTQLGIYASATLVGKLRS